MCEFRSLRVFAVYLRNRVRSRFGIVIELTRTCWLRLLLMWLIFLVPFFLQFSSIFLICHRSCILCSVRQWRVVLRIFGCRFSCLLCKKVLQLAHRLARSIVLFAALCWATHILGKGTRVSRLHVRYGRSGYNWIHLSMTQRGRFDQAKLHFTCTRVESLKSAFWKSIS